MGHVPDQRDGLRLIGVLMVLVTDVFMGLPLLRPFVGVGILGGFTTFSTYANEVRGLLRARRAAGGVRLSRRHLVCALLAVLAAMSVDRGPGAQVGHV